MARLVLLGALGLLACVHAAPGYNRGGNGDEKDINDTSGDVKAGEKANHALNIGGGDKGTENNKSNEHGEDVRRDSNTHDSNNYENSGSGGPLVAKEGQNENGNRGGGINSGSENSHGNSAGPEKESNNGAVKNNDKSNDLGIKGNDHESGYGSDVNAGKKDAGRYKRDESRGQGRGNQGGGGHHGGGGNGRGGNGRGGNGKGGSGGGGKNSGGGKGGRHRRSAGEFDFKGKGGKGGFGGGKGGGGGHGGGYGGGHGGGHKGGCKC